MDLMVAFINDEARDQSDRQLLNDLFGSLSIQIVRLTFDKLQRAIDFEASMEAGSSIIINSGYDAELDDLRKVYDSLEMHLSAAAHK
jgi:DNA mismatch repair ATPase MutS